MSTAKPKAVFFTGTNGSGKSSMREHMLKYGKFDQEYVHIDADKIAWLYCRYDGFGSRPFGHWEIQPSVKW